MLYDLTFIFNPLKTSFMKRIFYILAAVAATVFAASCNKSETVVTEIPNEIGFNSVSSNPTKAGELNGTSFDGENYCIYVSASQYNSRGIEENPLYFNDFLFRNDYASSAADWHHYASEAATEATPIYWPIGGARLDFLAYALPKGKKASIPAPTFNSTSYARDFGIDDWDTYANQVDLLYAAANNQTSAATAASPYVKLNFKHAQALLIFNVKIDAEAADSGLKIDDISFVSDEYVAARRAEFVAVPTPKTPATSTAPTAAQVPLLTQGDFFVDNLRNNLVASWSDLSSVAANWKMPDFASTPVVSTCNGTIADAIKYGTAIENTVYNQLGETLLIPEQPTQNFTITYTVGGKSMQYTVNVKHNGWQAGKKYIYNLDIDLNEIIVTEAVADFEADPDTFLMQ